VEITAPDGRNVRTMVLELLLLLLKLTFILGIVSSIFFQVEVGGRSLLRLQRPRKAAGAQITQSRHREVVTIHNHTGLLQVW